MDELEPDLHCSRCGYNLRGLPEDRCPECGFGYDRAAIRSLALSDNWERDQRARRTICWSALAVALIVGPISAKYIFGPPIHFGIALLAALGVVVLERWYGDPRPPTAWADIGYRDAAIMIVVFFSTGFGHRAPACNFPGTVALLVGWVTWVSSLAGSPIALNNATPDERMLLDSRSRLAMLSVAGATILIILAWWRL